MPTYSRVRHRTTGQLAGGITTRTRKSTGAVTTYHQGGAAKRYERTADYVGGYNNGLWPDKNAYHDDKIIERDARFITHTDRSGYIYNSNRRIGFSSPQDIVNANYFSDQELINKVAEINNPRKPIVDLPLFVYELKDVPELIRAAGSSLLRPRRSNPSDQYLAYNFGWAPLLGDLSKLLNLTQEIEKRKKQIDKKARTMRAEGGLGSFRHTWYGRKKSTSAYPGYIYYRMKYTTETRAWYVLKFSTFNPPPYNGLSGMERFTNALTSGSPIQTLWNALPWSWLADYFVDINTYLSANQGLTYFSGTNLNICQSCYCTTSVDVTSTSSYIEFEEFEPGLGVNRSWKRSTFPTVKPRLRVSPFLTGKQLSIIGALVTSSGRYNRSVRS